MQVSAKNLSLKQNQEIQFNLAQAICELKKLDEANQFLNDFLTETERVVLSKRLTIAILLRKKIAYEEIKKALNVSSATISGVSSMMKKTGFNQAVEKVNAEVWAEAQLHKLSNLFKK